MKMGDFSFLADSDEEKAVEELLSQAVDGAVLEQVAAINCSGFTDSVLPTPLEARFHKLKSLPSDASKPKPLAHSHSAAAASVFRNSNKDKDDDDHAALNLENSSAEKKGFKDTSKSAVDSKLPKSLSSSGKDEIFINSDRSPNGEKGLKEKLEPEFSPEDEFFWDSLKISEKKGSKKGLQLKSPSDSCSLPSNYSTESLSPPQRSGCLWCSPRRASRKNSKSGPSFGKGNEVLGDLDSYLEKNQQKLMKKAMEEEEKICREAEKIVNLVKQASARIEVSSLDDELSDTESL